MPKIYNPKLRGQSSTLYLGVNAPSPPNFVEFARAPTVNDFSGYIIGDYWLYQTTAPAVQEIWFLVNKEAAVATWIQVSAGGVGNLILQGDVGTATSVGGVIKNPGEWNINTVGDNVDKLSIYLNTSIRQPATNAAGDEGVYYLGAAGGVGGTTFLHSRGTQNTFVGQSSGNLGLTVLNAVRNTGVGFQTLQQNVDGENNVAIGESSLATIVDGDRNVAIGHGNLDQATDVDFNTSVGGDGLSQLLTGDYNTTLGYRSGFNYAGAESSNILLGSEGVLAESNVIRLGETGAGIGQQSACYIAGSYQSIVGGVNEVMLIDSTGKLGSSKGIDGEILIGATAGPPAWAGLASSDGSVIINTGVNSIDLTVGGAPGGGSTTFNTDVAGPAVVLGNVIIMAGDGIIQTDGTVANTVTIEMPDSTNGELLIAGGGGGPAWNPLTSTGGSITITYPGANQINLEAVGAGGGANTFQTDGGNAVAVGGIIDVLGGTNITTAGAGQTVTVNLDDSIALPDTNAAGTEGLYSLASGTTFMHNYGAAGTSYNTFLGQDAGNLTHTNSVDCTGVGYESLNSLTTGDANSCFASGSGKDITTGSNNTSLGVDSLFQVESGDSNCTVGMNSFNGIVTGSNNIGLGTSAGSNCTAADSSNILIGNIGSAGLSNVLKIGTTGGGAGQQSTAFIAATHGVTPAGATESVIIDANGQLGSVAGGGGTITQILGGDNINVDNGTGPISTVNLDLSIFQPHTNNTGTQGGYYLGGVTTGDRFLHNYSTTGNDQSKNIFLGRGAGNFTNSGLRNVGIGTGWAVPGEEPALFDLTSGVDNIALGTGAASNITSSDQNIAIGREALNQGVTSDSNVAIGQRALRRATGNINVAIGDRAAESLGAGALNIFIGDNVAFGAASGDSNTILGSSAYNTGTATTGSNNIVIGRAAGIDLRTTDSSNVLISNAGVATDNNTIRIGEQGTGAGQQDTAYMAGIYDSTVAPASGRQVFIDSTGKLGTGNGVSAFLYVQGINVTNATGDGTIYYLGAGGGSGLTEIYDQSSAVNPGNGAGTPLTFTAPVSGLYFLEVQFLATNLLAPPSPPPASTPINSDPSIITTKRTYNLINSVWQYQTNGRQSYFYNVIANMDVGDTAQFSVDINFTGTRNLGIGNTQTFVSGHLVAYGTF